MPKLLDDRAMWDFIVDGYTVVHADLPREFHRELHRDTEAAFEESRDTGNGIFAEIPALLDVFEQPNVRGTLTSILGPGYRFYSHRHCHRNAPGSDGQGMHLDSYEADENNRHHRPRWAMAFYYPHDVDEAMGPTSVAPGGQYHTSSDTRRRPDDEVCFTGKAGSVCIVHYDSWHRATANASALPRYMHKWLFIRTEEPTEPSWEHSSEFSPDCRETADLHSRTHGDMWRNVWDWYSGVSADSASDGEPDALCAALSDESETVRLNAAYALGRVGARAVEPLIDAFRDETEGRLEANLAASMTNPSHLYSGYALSAVGGPAVEALVDELGSDAWSVRAAAANILGDIGVAAEGSAPALAALLDDDEAWVRRNAVEALGHLGQASAEGAPSVAGLLTDDVEWVRLNAAVALTRIGPIAAAAVPDLVSALDDGAYYVRANAAHALDAIGDVSAREALATYRASGSDY